MLTKIFFLKYTSGFMFKHFKQMIPTIFVHLTRFAVAFTMKMKELAAAEWVSLHDDGDAYSIINYAFS